MCFAPISGGTPYPGGMHVTPQRGVRPVEAGCAPR